MITAQTATMAGLAWIIQQGQYSYDPNLPIRLLDSSDYNYVLKRQFKDGKIDMRLISTNPRYVERYIRSTLLTPLNKGYKVEAQYTDGSGTYDFMLKVPAVGKDFTGSFNYAEFRGVFEDYYTAKIYDSKTNRELTFKMVN